MKLKELVNATIESGITPIRIAYEPITQVENAKKIVRTSLIIESLTIGTLTFSEYRYVARRTKRGDDLAARHIEKLFRAIQNGEDNDTVECYTLPMPARLIKNNKLSEMLFMAFTDFPDVNPSQVCVELSADVLFEDTEEMQKGVQSVLDLGVKVAITEVGDEFCPIFRLIKYKFDYAFLDKVIINNLKTEKDLSLAGSIVEILHCLKVKVFAPFITSDKQISVLSSLNVDGYGKDSTLYLGAGGGADNG